MSIEQTINEVNKGFEDASNSFKKSYTALMVCIFLLVICMLVLIFKK